MGSVSRNSEAADQAWMRLACEQAVRGLGRTAPNPAVGCVIVKAGRVVGHGYHRAAGLAHAEIEALRSAGRSVRGADVYVTLEPCCHSGLTGPCTDALLAAKVRRVVAGCRDPNPRVAGRGMRQLARAGVETSVGIREAECLDLIRGFRSYMIHGLPWVGLKLAASLDGRIATATGASKWLSSVPSRRRVQSMRSRVDAILVGVGTVLRDDPRLTVRRRGADQPIRVILDRQLRTPPHSRVVLGRGACLICCASTASQSRRRRLENAGAEVVVHGGGRRGWLSLLRMLGARGVREVLIEGGATVATSAIAARVVNGLTIFYTPKLIGADGVPLLTELGVRDPNRAPIVFRTSVEVSGPDVVWEGEFQHR